MVKKIVTLFMVCVQIALCFDYDRFELPSKSKGKIWALLVAGSNTYSNYRHQADICHSYHVLHNHGIPDDQIIVMMYDDIANSEENPTKGIIINHPNGKDVYNGVLKDYIGEAVTPQNFLNVLQGNSEAMKNVGSGRVINSGPDDHIFVYFADHGAPGLVAFPNGELYATDLNAALKNMYAKKRYSKMVIYIEACESGSMFDSLLPDNINIFATTAANPDESSYACYWDDKRETYLGDVYSVKWMEDSDTEALNTETLNKQFRIVKKETNTSHVQEYGDLSIGKMKVSQFQGAKAKIQNERLPRVDLDAVPSHEVPLVTLKRKIASTNSWIEEKQLQKKLTKLLRDREFLLNKVKTIVDKSTFTARQSDTIMSERFKLTDFDCYNEVAKYFSQNCFSLSDNDYALRYLYTFVNLCETGIHASVQKMAMDAVCLHPTVKGIV